MKPLKERLPLIDEAIDYHKSWPKHNLWCLVQIKDAGRWLYAFTGHTLTGGKFICTRDEFNERKRELEDKEQDMNDWYSKGVRPPIGTKCEVEVSGAWHVTEVVGYNKANGNVVFTAFDITGHIYDGMHPKRFRPLRTETDKLVDEAELDIKSLPPVDSECIAKFLPNEAMGKDKQVDDGRCIIRGYNGKLVWLQWWRGENFVNRVDNFEFRPLRAETDELVEQMIVDAIGSGFLNRDNTGGFISEFIEKLVDKGYRKTKPMSEDDFCSQAQKELTDFIGRNQLVKLHRAGCVFLDKGDDHERS